MIFYAGNILSKHGYTPTFIESLTPKFSEKYKIVSVSDKKNQLHRLTDMVFTLIRYRKQIKVALIDSYSMRAFWYTYILARLCRYYKIPFIPILRGGGYPERLAKSKKLCDFIFKNSSKNISPSVFLQKHFVNAGYSVEYIPNYIPLENYEFKLRSEVKPKLLWVRSFDKTYNPVMAIEVLNLIKKKYPQSYLCMVGPDKDGSINDVKSKTKALNLEDSVTFTGRLSKFEWISLSRDYDIFINTTDYDNHPVSVIEAMALGLPVVTTNVGGIPFLIEDKIDGLLSNKGDSEMFASKIDELLQNKELTKNISASARKKAEEFDWEVIKEKWYEVLNSYYK